MNTQEAKTQAERLEQFNRLTAILDNLYAAKRQITGEDKSGPHNQNPFTGNWRESREIVSMTIKFSRTRGGAPPVELAIENLLISACTVGNDLSRAIQTRINEFQKGIEGL